VPGRGYLLAVPVSRVPDAQTASNASPQQKPAALALPDRPSIAVLPFNNMSDDASQAFFSDGITEDITSALCRLKGFFVIARTTAFTYKDRPKDIRIIGRELGVRYVLEGSVRKAGGKIRVTAQLLEAETGNHLWAERYDRDLEDIFAIQDEITASIVGRIGPELLSAEYARMNRRAPHNLDAWECVVRALFHSSQQSEQESRNALDLLDRALASDPSYAQALGIKAWILVFRAFQGWEDMEGAPGKAILLIAQAMALDNNSGRTLPREWLLFRRATTPLRWRRWRARSQSVPIPSTPTDFSALHMHSAVVRLKPSRASTMGCGSVRATHFSQTSSFTTHSLTSRGLVTSSRCSLPSMCIICGGPSVSHVGLVYWGGLVSSDER
jgi:TolB-like protein